MQWPRYGYDIGSARGSWEEPLWPVRDTRYRPTYHAPLPRYHVQPAYHGPATYYHAAQPYYVPRVVYPRWGYVRYTRFRR